LDKIIKGSVMSEAPTGNHPLADEIRRLMQASRRASLGTLAERDQLTFPFVSLVIPALAADATPILLMSDLADHSKHLQQRPQASLLFNGTLDLAEPLTGPRVTLLGQVTITTATDDRATYLTQHPEAALYADFRDFRFYRFIAQEALFVAGFGRIHRLAGGDLRQST
jgi:putative heme iron utilization protein